MKKNKYVLSAKRCGSTIIQNIGFFILYKKKGRLKKTHNFVSVEKNDMVLLPIRNPRDVAVSLKRTLIDDYYKKTKIKTEINNLSFLNDKIIKDQLNLMLKLYSCYSKNQNVLILKYEDVFKNGIGDYDILIKKISKFYKVNLNKSNIDLLKKTYDIHQLYDVSSNMSTFKLNDHNTTKYGLHGKHISQIEKVNDIWKDWIPENLHIEYCKQLKYYTDKLGYK